MSSTPSTPLSRRRWFAGAGTAGIAAATWATLAPKVQDTPQAEAPRPAPQRGGGYSLSEHVQHYYRTTRV